jgi:hypothetical protein
MWDMRDRAWQEELHMKPRARRVSPAMAVALTALFVA